MLGGKIESLNIPAPTNLVVGRLYGAGINVRRTNNDGSINILTASGPTKDYGFLQVSEVGKLIYMNSITNIYSEWNFGCNTLAELKAALANV